MYIDTHAHLFFSSLDQDLGNVIQRAKDADVKRIVCVGVDVPTSKKSIEIAEKYEGVYATVGVHPHDVKDASPNYLSELETLARSKKVVAIGEIGLDFFRNLTPTELQIDAFIKQLTLAASLSLPVIVHNRNSDDECLNCLRQVGFFKGVMHCFSQDELFAKKILDLGLMISFTGNITFEKTLSKPVVQYVPLDRMMLETDSPYLSPHPKRGKMNEPFNIPLVASKIAEIKGVRVEEVRNATSRVAKEFFRLPEVTPI